MTRFLTGQLSKNIRGGASAAVLAALTAACGGSEPGLVRGKMLFDTCSPCHGDDGAGKQSLGAPAIAGASEWYLSAQLLKFRGGVRGYHHTDTEGLRMRPMSRALVDDSGDIESIVEYVVSLPIPDPPPTAEGGDVEAGETTYMEACVSCHGRDGRGVDQGVPELNPPSLLHLNDWYIESSLRKYRDGVRGVGDAAGDNMRTYAEGLSDEEIFDVTAYIMTMQRLPRKIPAPPLPPLPPVDVDPAILPEGVTVEMVQEGQDIFNTTVGICFTCHLREGVGGPLAPPLTDDEWLNIDGEYESIIEIITNGVPAPVEYPGQMAPRANRPLTDEQVRAVAAYVFTLSR